MWEILILVAVFVLCNHVQQVTEKRNKEKQKAEYEKQKQTFKNYVFHFIMHTTHLPIDDIRADFLTRADNNYMSCETGVFDHVIARKESDMRWSVSIGSGQVQGYLDHPRIHILFDTDQPYTVFVYMTSTHELINEISAMKLVPHFDRTEYANGLHGVISSISFYDVAFEEQKANELFQKVSEFSRGLSRHLTRCGYRFGKSLAQMEYETIYIQRTRNLNARCRSESWHRFFFSQYNMLNTEVSRRLEALKSNSFRSRQQMLLLVDSHPFNAKTKTILAKAGIPIPDKEPAFIKFLKVCLLTTTKHRFTPPMKDKEAHFELCFGFAFHNEYLEEEKILKLENSPDSWPSMLNRLSGDDQQVLDTKILLTGEENCMNPDFARTVVKRAFPNMYGRQYEWTYW